MVGPQLTANTSDTNTGEEVARFQAKLKCQIKNKHFAEHGYIVGVASCRPLLMFDERGAMDTYTPYPSGLANWIDTFYSADNLQTKDMTRNRVNGIDDADGPWVQRNLKW